MSRATRTRSACCAASRVAARARTRGGSTPSPASWPRSTSSCPRASMRTAARSPRKSAEPSNRRCTGSRPPTPADATSTSRRKICLARRRPTSGSRKTTFAQTLLGLASPSGGTVELDGRALAPRLFQRTQQDVRVLQIVFQNPDSALNRRHTVRRILRRSLKKLAGVTGAAAEARLLQLAGAVRLAARYLTVRPNQLSGGLKQRVAIARAFAGEPRLVICDEPTSSLDVSVQAAILNLLVELQAERKVAYLFISHDLGVVRYISDRIAVLYLGRLMELGPAQVVFAAPHHPYTEALLSAVPTIDGGGRDRIKLSGEIPSAAAPPTGCVFHTRCHRFLGKICEDVEPPLIEVEDGHQMRCHIPLEELRRLQTLPKEVSTSKAG